MSISMSGATRPVTTSVRPARRAWWSVSALALLGMIALVASCVPQPATPTSSTTTTTIAPADLHFAVGDSCDPMASRYQFLVAGQGGTVQPLFGQNFMLMYGGVVAFQCVEGAAATVDPMTKISVGDYCAYNDTQNRGIFVYKVYDGQDEGTVRATTDALGRSVLTCVPSATPPTTTLPTTTVPTTTTTIAGTLTSFAVGDSCDPMRSNYEYLTAGQGGTIQPLFGQDFMLMYGGVVVFQCVGGAAATVDPMTKISVGDYCTYDGIPEQGIFIYKFNPNQVDGTVRATTDGSGRQVLTCNPSVTAPTTTAPTTTAPTTTTTIVTTLTSFAVGDSCDPMASRNGDLVSGQGGTIQPLYGQNLMLMYGGVVLFRCVGGAAATVDPMTKISVGDYCTYNGVGMSQGLFIYKYNQNQVDGMVQATTDGFGRQVLTCSPPTP